MSSGLGRLKIHLQAEANAKKDTKKRVSALKYGLKLEASGKKALKVGNKTKIKQKHWEAMALGNILDGKSIQRDAVKGHKTKKK